MARKKQTFDITDCRFYPTKQYPWTIIAPKADYKPIFYQGGPRKWWRSEWAALQYANTILAREPQAELVVVKGISRASVRQPIEVSSLPSHYEESGNGIPA